MQELVHHFAIDFEGHYRDFDNAQVRDVVDNVFRIAKQISHQESNDNVIDENYTKDLLKSIISQLSEIDSELSEK